MDYHKENILALVMAALTGLSSTVCLRKMGIEEDDRVSSGAAAYKYRGLSNEELLDMLDRKAMDLGRTPTMEEISNDEDMPSPACYQSRFGTYKEACRIAKLTPNKVGGDWKGLRKGVV